MSYHRLLHDLHEQKTRGHLVELHLDHGRCYCRLCLDRLRDKPPVRLFFVGSL